MTHYFCIADAASCVTVGGGLEQFLPTTSSCYSPAEILSANQITELRFSYYYRSRVRCSLLVVIDSSSSSSAVVQRTDAEHLGVCTIQEHKIEQDTSRAQSDITQVQTG